jgi:16S rRNA processing protein RimM
MSTQEQSDRPNDARQPPKFLAVGQVLRPHGVRGALLIQSDTELIFTISPGSNVYLGESHNPMTVKRLNPHRKHFLLIVEEIESREEADQFRGAVLDIDFEDAESLPEGVYYHWQLEGIEVFTEDDERLGVLEQIIITGANDVYVVRSDTGEEVLLPAIESVIKNVDLQAQRMTVHVLPGLI